MTKGEKIAAWFGLGYDFVDSAATPVNPAYGYVVSLCNRTQHYNSHPTGAHIDAFLASSMWPPGGYWCWGSKRYNALLWSTGLGMLSVAVWEQDYSTACSLALKEKQLTLWDCAQKKHQPANASAAPNSINPYVYSRPLPPPVIPLRQELPLTTNEAFITVPQKDCCPRCGTRLSFKNLADYCRPCDRVYL